MNNERYNQIIDEAYENYITQIRIEFEKWCQQNPGALVNYREDTRELFLKSIKEDKHWFTGEKKFSERWGLKIEERELMAIERWDLYGKHGGPNGEVKFVGLITYKNEESNQHIHEWLDKYAPNIPTKLITLIYKDETIEVYE